MGNALVAIDTGLALFKLPFQGMPFAGGFILDFEIHRFQCVAVTAFPRIRRLHLGPDMFGHLEPLGFKLLARIDRA